MLASALTGAILIGASLARTIGIGNGRTRWDGFPSLESVFVFGDSYTATGFSPTGTPPSPSNPLGNPTYPGITSSNGPNWVDYLTVKHNASGVLTYNLASGGASIDSAVIPSPIEPVLSMRGQVEQFNTYYKNSSSWHPSRTLFAVWIGINDVNSAYDDPDWPSLMPRAVQVYADLLKELYSSGARNFLLLAVPPLDLTPMVQKGGADNVALNKAAVDGFNAEVKKTVVDGMGGVDGVNVWWFDANALFRGVIRQPALYPETSHFSNTLGYCKAYASGTPEPDTFDPSCDAPVDEYLWLNELHPTAPMHDLIARQAAELVGLV